MARTLATMSSVASAMCCTPGPPKNSRYSSICDLRLPAAGSFSGNFTLRVPSATTLLISAEYSVAMSSPTNSFMLVKPMTRW